MKLRWPLSYASRPFSSAKPAVVGRHLQMLLEYGSVPVNHSKMFKHSVGDLITYARSLGIPFSVSDYVDTHAGTITSWEAEGRYDIHVIVRIDVLEKAYSEINSWYCELQKNGYQT